VSVTATATSGLTVTFTTKTPSVCTAGGATGSTIALVGAGTCTVVAAQTGDSKYAAALSVQQSFAVTQVAQTITFGALANRPLAQSPATVTATATSGLPVTFTSKSAKVCTAGGANGATISLLTKGTCKIQANQAGTAVFSPAPAVQQSFVVS
jgi:hypothetical protein